MTQTMFPQFACILLYAGGPLAMGLDPGRQRLLGHAQTTRRRRNVLARLRQPHSLPLKLRRVPFPLFISHLRFPFAIKSARYRIRFVRAVSFWLTIVIT